MTRPNLEQGEGGVHTTRKTTKGTDLAPGASTKGPSISQKGGKIPAKNDGTNPSSGTDHLTPHKALTNQPSPVRGGGTVIGHDRVDPNAGKAYSGPKFAVRNVKQIIAKELLARRGQRQAPADKTFLGR